MQTYTLHEILIEADSEHGIPDGHLRYDEWRPGLPIHQGRLRIRPVVPLPDQTLRDYLTEAFGAWASDDMAATVGRIVDAAKERIGPWVDQAGSAVTAAHAQNVGKDSLVVVITDMECRNTARLRIDLDEPTASSVRTGREYYLASVTTRARPTPESQNRLGLGWTSVTLYRVAPGRVVPVRPRIPDGDWSLETYLSEVGLPGDVCEAVKAKAIEQFGDWVGRIATDVTAGIHSDGYGALTLYVTHFEGQQAAEIVLEFGPRRATADDQPGEAPQT